MRRSWMPVLSCVVLWACAPVLDADAPVDEDERPCRSDDDCELRDAPRGPSRQLCETRAINWDGARNEKAAAMCGPMPNMTPNIPEPRLLCFRGSCVPVDRVR